ncbi:choice-of-anchor D domain-containing protein [Limibacter armeniacum]|uniref:Ig-like domain-containing protein n=1 Tax=Limibacter armeniacum TaxID=466084 RepID=UPI002FE69523
MVNSLLPATTYYFAIKSADYFRNSSEISNVVTGTTEDAPTIAISGDPSVSIDVSIETTATGTFTIQNTGANKALTYNILPIYGGIVENTVTSTLLYPGTATDVAFPEMQTTSVHQVFDNQVINSGSSASVGLNFMNEEKNVLAYDDGDDEVAGALKVTNVDGNYIPWTSATSFEVPEMEDSFILSHIKAYMQVSFDAAKEETRLVIIKGGETPLEGELLLSQDIDNKEGNWFLDIPLEMPLVFETGDQFWVAFVFPENRVEYGYDIVDGGHRANTNLAYMNGEWIDIQSIPGYEDYVWAVRAIERTVEGLELDINQGVVEPLASQAIQVTYDAADIVRNGDYDFDLYVVSNDPINPVTVVDAKATITGLLEPEMVVTPDSIITSIDAAVNTIATETVTITNTGDGDLVFDFENEIEVPKVSIAAVTAQPMALDVPVSADVAPYVSSEVDASVPVAKYSAGAIAYAHQIHPEEFLITFSTTEPGEYISQGGLIDYNVLSADFLKGDATNMYFINDNTETLMKLNIETGERTVIGATLPFNDITTDKFANVVYGTDFNGYTSDLYILDVKTGGATKVGSMGDGIMVAIACDGEGEMWGFKLNDGNIYHIDKTTAEAKPVGHVGFTANYNQSMSWDPKSNIIYLSAYNYIEERGELRVVDTTTGATELVGIFPNNSQVSALAFQGGGYHNFTSVLPVRGTVAPSESMTVEVTIDATELPNGNYYTPLSFSTNDYDDLNHIIPVSLEVTGQIGELKVDHQIKDFGSVLLGAEKDFELTLENVGIGSLDINSITSDNALFTTDFEGVETIDMRESMKLKIRFKPEAVGQFNAVLTINSNDPKNGETKIVMTGSSVLPPVIEIVPDTIEVTLNSGEVVKRQFAIKNTGAYPLQYSMPEYAVNKEQAEKEANGEGVSLNGLGGPDETGYRWIDSNDSNGPVFVWDDIASDTTEIMPGMQGGSLSVDLPFTFPFYAEDQTSMSISTEGFVMFGTVGATSNFNRNIPNAYTPNGMIAPFWDNLRNSPTKYGHMYYKEFADRVIVQWDSVGAGPFNSGGSISLQTVLYPDGKMMFYYDQVSLEVKNSATIGIENADGTEGLQIAYNEQYVEDKLAVLIFPGYKGYNNVVIDKTSGIIPSGEEEIIEVTMDASGLLEGSYSHELYISNNDPITPKGQFTSVLHVIGHPEIAVSDTTITFDPITESLSVVKSLTIENKGSKELMINDITTSDASLVTSFPGATTLLPGEKMLLEVTFTPTVAGAFTGTINIDSDDDFGNAALAIAVSGSAITSPEMKVTSEINPVDLTLVSGEKDTVSVMVENLSGTTLNYVVHAPSFAKIDGVTGTSVVQGVDNFGYTWADSDSSDAVTYNWIDIANEGNRLPLGEGNGIFVNLPFRFPFYGNAFDKVQVASNGFLTFNSNLGSSGGSTNRAMPNNYDPHNQIAVLWDDLDPEEMGDVYYLATANALIVQYNNVMRDYSDYTATFQVILYANGDIKMQYKDVEDYRQINSVSVGIENEDGTDGLTVVHNELYYLKNELAVMITSPYYKGSLEAGASETVDLLIDTETIYDGVYSEPIRIVSNDAANLVTDIMATLTVTGTQQMTLSADAIEFDSLFYVEGENFDQIKEFTVHNMGTKTLAIDSLWFSEKVAGFASDKMYSFTVAPKDSATIRVKFTPEQAGVFMDTLNLRSDDTTSPIVSVALKGTALLPPVVTASTLDILRLEMLTTDIATDVMSLGNEGNSDLSYEADIKYYPYGLPEVMTAGVTSFGDSIYYDLDTIPHGYYGQNGQSTSKVAVKFTPESAKFYLTHVSNFYKNEGAIEPSLMQVYKGGTRPENGEFLLSQQFTHSEAVEGYNAIIELNKPQLFYEGEYFWVVFTYPKSMPHPAAYNDRTPEMERASWYFINGYGWVSDGTHNFKIRALEQTGGYGDWLSIDPTSGNVDADTTQEVTFNVDASKVDRSGYHYAMVTYHTNDPLTPSVQRAVEIYVNHKPSLEVLNNIYVQEGDSVAFVAKASDVDGSIASIALLENDAFTSIEVNDNTATITYSPDFEQAGDHIISLVVTDDKGESVTVPVNVTVSNVNRAPMANAVDDMQKYRFEGVASIVGTDIFTDADGDELTYRAEVVDESVALVTATASGFDITPLTDGVTAVTLFASDGFLEVSTAFNLTIVGNRAPEIVAELEAVEVEISKQYTFDFGAVFTDADGDELTYSLISNDAAIAEVYVSGTKAIVTPAAIGQTFITLTAMDTEGAEVSFDLTLNVIADIVLAVDDELAVTGLQLYPNPANDFVNIRWNNGGSQANMTVKLVNAIGVVLFTEDVKSAETYTINLSGKPAGIYYVQLISEGKTAVRKIIKK